MSTASRKKHDHNALLKSWRTKVVSWKGQASTLDQVFSTFNSWEQRNYTAAINIIDSCEQSLPTDAPPAEFVTVRRGKRRRASSSTTPTDAALNHFVSLRPEVQTETFATLSDALEAHRVIQREHDLNQARLAEQQQLIKQLQKENRALAQQQGRGASSVADVDVADFDNGEDESTDLVPSNTLSFEDFQKGPHANLAITTPRGTKITSGSQMVGKPNLFKPSAAAGAGATPLKKKAAAPGGPLQRDIVVKPAAGPAGSRFSTIQKPGGLLSSVKKTTKVAMAALGSRIGGQGATAGAKATLPSGSRLQQQQPLPSKPAVSTRAAGGAPATPSRAGPASQRHQHATVQDQSDSDLFEDLEECSEGPLGDQALWVSPNHDAHNRSADLSVDSLNLDTADLGAFHAEMQHRIQVSVQREASPASSKKAFVKKLRPLSESSESEELDSDSLAPSSAVKRRAPSQLQRKTGPKRGTSGSQEYDDRSSDGDDDSEDDSDDDVDDDDYDTPVKTSKSKVTKVASVTKKAPGTAKKASLARQPPQAQLPRLPAATIDVEAGADGNPSPAGSSEVWSSVETPLASETGAGAFDQFQRFLDQRVSPPMNNLKIGAVRLDAAAAAAALHPSLASPSRTASARAFGKHTLINQAPVGKQFALGQKPSGFAVTKNGRSAAAPASLESLELSEQLEKQKLIKQRALVESELSESKRLENVYRNASKQLNKPISTATTPVAPLTPILVDKVTRAKEVSRSVAAQTPRFPKDPIGIVHEPPGSDVEHDDIIPDHFIPAWAEESNVCAIQERQALVDADAIFIQPRANWCKTEEMFHSTIYHPDIIARYGGPRRKQRPRGSSAYWGKDRLQDHEIKACNKALGIYTDNY